MMGKDKSGQVMLISAFMLAIVVVAITLMLNNVIYSSNMAYVGYMDQSRYDDLSYKQATANEATYAHYAYVSDSAKYGTYMDDYKKCLNNLSSAKGGYIELTSSTSPATNPLPLPDPIVYFAGGPGGAATDEVGDMAVVFSALSRDRDVLFVDQRGVGGSNELVCQGPMPDDAASKAMAERVATCLGGLDADPRFYTTSMAADDVADVLHALGYSRANLYGGS
jgi:pimeloyl-ACP methyl ester carboxylesterase